jgi:peptidoglycan-associated lipoprotein
MQFLSKVLPVAVFTLASFSLNAQTLLEKADKQYDMHAFKAAADGYETILSRDAEEYPVAIKLADTYYHLNDLTKAAKWYGYAEHGTALTPKATLNYGKILMMQGKYDFAVVQFQKYRAADGATADHYIKSCLFALQPSDVLTDLTVKSATKINSESSDFAPTIVGDKLIWSSARTDIKRGDINKPMPSSTH